MKNMCVKEYVKIPLGKTCANYTDYEILELKKQKSQFCPTQQPSNCQWQIFVTNEEDNLV